MTFVPLEEPPGLAAPRGFAPASMLDAVLASALLWSAGFGLYALHDWPILTQPRLDVRPG